MKNKIHANRLRNLFKRGILSIRLQAQAIPEQIIYLPTPQSRDVSSDNIRRWNDDSGETIDRLELTVQQYHLQLLRSADRDRSTRRTKRDKGDVQ